MKEEEIRPKELFQQYLELSRKDAEKFNQNEFEHIDCIACGSSNYESKFLKYGFNYQLCKECETLFCSPRPSRKTLEDFYMNSNSAKFWFETFLPKVEESRRNRIFRKKAIQLFDLIENKGINVNSLCDVGAGSGIFLEELKKIRGDIEYSAIEPGEVSSKIVRGKGFSVLQESAETASKWKGNFDFVVSLEVLEHVYDPLIFVKSLRTLLKKDGYCLVTTLGYEGFDIQVLGEKSNSISPPHHLNFPSVKGFEILFERAGLSEISVFTPGVLDVDIVLNSENSPEFLNVMQLRGKETLNDFQQFLIENKLSSHVWVLAKK